MPFFGNKRRDFSIQPPRQQVDGTPFFVTDSANIDFTLNNLNLTADLTFTGVTAGTYGDATNIPVLQIDQWGRVTGVTLQPISPSGLALETNSIANGSQTLLNLVQGTNMTITDLGSGNIRFDATGGGSGIDGANSRRWTGLNTASAPPPGLARLRATAGATTYTPSDVIDIRISRYDETNADMQSWFTALNNYRTTNPGKAYVQITDSLDNSVFGIYQIGNMAYTSTIYDYWTIGLTYVSGSVNLFSGGSTITFSWVLFGADGTGGGGGSGSILHGTAAGIDTYTVTITGATAYADGDAYLIRFTNGNTTGCTLNINGQGAVPLYRNNDGPLIGGDILDGAEMLCVYNSTTNRFQVIGTSPNTLLSYVTNDDTVTLTKGMAVFAFSGTGDRMTVQRASNLSDSTSAQTVGLVLSSSIAPNQKGIIMMQGLLDGLNILPTATWNDGDPVFLGDTPGSITPTKPYAPKHLVYLGVVTTANNGFAGRMYVKVQNGYELDELHNVQAQSPNLNDTLYYDNTVTPAQWKTTSVNTLLNTSIKTGSCGVTFDGQGGVISNGRTAYVQVPYNGTLTGWTLVAAQSGSCTITVFKDTYANYPPVTPADNIYSVQPALASAIRNQNLTPTYVGSQATVTAGDWIGFTISGVTTVTWVNLTISITKT